MSTWCAFAPSSDPSPHGRGKRLPRTAPPAQCLPGGNNATIRIKKQDHSHSEFKTDLDLERLPSGKFDANALVCALAALAMNILRLLGASGLHGPDAPVRHEAKRRRIKTVIQELIYRAARLIDHGRCHVLGLGANDRSAQAFGRLHDQLLAGCG